MCSQLASQLITSYFYQLQDGCDSIYCQEPECKSNPSFQYHFSNPNEIAYQAIKNTLQHPYADHLCPGINPIKLDPVLHQDLILLNNIARQLIKTNGKFTMTDENQVDYNFLSNPTVFPFFLISNSEKLSVENMAIDEDEFLQFVRILQQKPAFLIPFPSFLQLVDQINQSYSNTYHHIRALILLLCFEPYLTDEDRSFDLLDGIIRHIEQMPQRSHDTFFKALTNLPKILSSILEICQNCLTIRLINRPAPYTSKPFLNFALFFDNLRELSSNHSRYPLTSKRFSNDEYAGLIDPRRLLKDPNSPILLEHPAILPLSFKNNYFHAQQQIKQDMLASNAATRHALNAMFQGRMAQITREGILRDSHLTINVHRNNIILDTINAISQIRAEQLALPLMVKFVGEEGVDAGGVSREYYHLLMKELFSPDYGMFVLLRDKYYWFNHFSQEWGVQPDLFCTLGTVVAIAVYNGIILPIRFPLFLYKKLLNKTKFTTADLAEYDPEIANSFHSMLEMKKKGEDVSSLYLTFSTTIDKLGTPVNVPIAPHGDEIEVNNENVEMYIDTYIDWLLNSSIESQFKSFSQGFKKLFNDKSLSMFAPDELDILVSGEEVFEWEELQKNAIYKDGYNRNSKQIKWFWEIFNQMSSDMKTKFLQFTTGSSRAPVGGLAQVKITIQKGHDNTKLPVSHTCFSIFVLPAYKSQNIMKQKVEIALTQTEGFGLI